MNFDHRPYKKEQCLCLCFIILLMIYYVLLYLATYFVVVRMDTCADPGGVGPCLMGSCPSPMMVCITQADICCQSNRVVADPTAPPVTIPPPSTTAAPVAVVTVPAVATARVTSVTVVPANCYDRLNPSTGVSDCSSRAYLCQNTLYYDLMTQQCPLTCGRCGTSATSNTTVCVDKLNPNTGLSDCPSMASYCSDSAYYTLMTDQCPRTCGRCSASSTTSTTTCIDKLNPKTNVSDCPDMASYCNDSRYYTLMTEQCPKTCSRCSGTSVSSPTTCVDKVNPSTNISDCPGMASYCRVSAYITLMQQQCPKTCGYC